MKTLEQLKQYEFQCLDRRDLIRLAQFIPFDDARDFGITPDETVSCEQWDADTIPFTRENILIQLEKDVDFGFEKALNQRGLSANAMYEVVKMWNIILEEGLEDFDDYKYYGLPLFKATALKYGFVNEIREDEGNERKYNNYYG